jgi:hypothetical protein
MEQEILVALLTVTQKDELVGQLYAPDSYFNPIQDGNGNWIISTQEQEFCVVEKFYWIKDLPLIPYVPVPSPEPGPTGPTGNNI